MTPSLSLWSHPPEPLTLGGDEVHVWRVELTQPAARIEALRQTLAWDEVNRADRFYFQKDRDHFIVARGALRAILGRYLKRAPDQLRFRCSSYGKPSLADDNGGDWLCFNVSHSHELALIAVTHGRAVGVDLEHIRPDVATEQIAEKFFSPREVAALRLLPVAEQTEAFFNCWTRKEAYIKARGEGLSFPLSRFDVSLAPGEPAKLLRTEGDPQEAQRWSLRELLPGPGYVAALAVEGHEWRLHCWQWSEAPPAP
jgi:4'-phosphopantetheinyl transferase